MAWEQESYVFKNKKKNKQIDNYQFRLEQTENKALYIFTTKSLFCKRGKISVV